MSLEQGETLMIDVQKCLQTMIEYIIVVGSLVQSIHYNWISY